MTVGNVREIFEIYFSSLFNERSLFLSQFTFFHQGIYLNLVKKIF